MLGTLYKKGVLLCNTPFLSALLPLPLAVISPAGGLILVPAAASASASPVPAILVVIRTSNLVVQRLYNRLFTAYCFRSMDCWCGKQPRTSHAPRCKENSCHCHCLEFCCHDGSSFLPHPGGFHFSLSLLYPFPMQELLGNYEENVKGRVHESRACWCRPKNRVWQILTDFVLSSYKKEQPARTSRLATRDRRLLPKQQPPYFRLL